EAPDESMRVRRREVVLEVDVEGVEVVDEYALRRERGAADHKRRRRHAEVRAIIVHLQAETIVAGERSRPARQHVAAGNPGLAAGDVAVVAAIDVALHCELVELAGSRIEPEAHLAELRRVIDERAAGGDRLV